MAARVLASSGCLATPSAIRQTVLTHVLSHPETASEPCQIELKVEAMDTPDGDSIGAMFLMKGVPVPGQPVRQLRWKMSALSDDWAATLMYDNAPDVFHAYTPISSGNWTPPLSVSASFFASLALFRADPAISLHMLFTDTDARTYEFVRSGEHPAGGPCQVELVAREFDMVEA